MTLTLSDLAVTTLRERKRLVADGRTAHRGTHES